MALTLEVVNGDRNGDLDGVHAVATVAGAQDDVTFVAGRLHPEFLNGDSIAADDVSSGVYELVLADRWLWWVTATDGAAEASDPVWIWGADAPLEEEVADALQLILEYNVPAIKKRMATVDSGVDALPMPVIYGLDEEVTQFPSIAFRKQATSSVPHSTSFDRRYTPQFTITCFAYRLDDPNSNEALIGMMAAAVRDLLLLHAHWTLPSGLKWSAGIASDIEFSDVVGPDTKFFGMARLAWSCQTDYAIPAAY